MSVIATVEPAPAYTLGPELLTNADITSDTGWTNGGSWFYTDGSYIVFGVLPASSLTQTVTTEDAAEYLISYKIAASAGDGLTVSFGGSEIMPNLLGRGVYTVIVTASGVSNTLDFNCNGEVVLLESASIKKITRSPSLGPELLANADITSDVSWTKGGSWLYFAGAYFTFGNLPASSLTQTVTTVDGAEYRISYDISANSGDGITVSFGGSEIMGSLVGSGVYTVDVTASGVSNTLDFNCNGEAVSVSSASIKKIGG